MLKLNFREDNYGFDMMLELKFNKKMMLKLKLSERTMLKFREKDGVDVEVEVE